MVRHLVLGVLSGSARDFAVHSRLVALQKRQVVTVAQHLRDFQLVVRGPLQGIRGLSEPVERKIVGGKTLIRQRVAAVELLLEVIARAAGGGIIRAGARER